MMHQVLLLSITILASDKESSQELVTGNVKYPKKIITGILPRFRLEMRQDLGKKLAVGKVYLSLTS